MFGVGLGVVSFGPFLMKLGSGYSYHLDVTEFCLERYSLGPDLWASLWALDLVRISHDQN